jgi:hypothetical protein
MQKSTCPVCTCCVLQVATGSRVSGSFIVALEVLHQGDMTAAGAAVASLAWQQLQALPTSLLWDLAWLVQDGVQQQDAAQVQLFGGLLRHYVQVRGCSVCRDTLSEPAPCRFAVFLRSLTRCCLEANCSSTYTPSG